MKPRPRPARFLIATSVAASLAVGSFAISIAQQPADESGQAPAATTPSQTTSKPTYVGRKTCAECHQENFQLHAKHGHAATFFEVSETDLAKSYVGQSVDGGKEFGTYQYRVDESGKLFAQLADLKELPELPLQYAVGSGHNAQTILTLLAEGEQGTFGIEHRITCYQGDRLGLTVGQEKKTAPTAIQRYGDRIQGEPLERCIFCHTTTATVVGGRIDNLVSHVNCEKCHGPGSEHVRLARLSDNPPPYSVGLAEWDTESEIQLCGDCHRLPRSLSKTELREYPDNLARFQPVGLLRSECYLQSGRQLKCSTCHNPHQSVHGVAKSVYVAQCVSCHDQEQTDHTVCPVNASSGCIECHMPAIDQSQGIKFHDHWIRVRD